MGSGIANVNEMEQYLDDIRDTVELHFGMPLYKEISNIMIRICFRI